MPRILTFHKPNKITLLHDQLLAAGITPLLVEGTPEAVSITVADSVQDADVNAVVNAHDPTVLSPVEVAAAAHVATITELNDAYASMNARLTDIETNGATYTTDQVRDAVKDMATMIRNFLLYFRGVL